MIKIGEWNHLEVVKEKDFGIYLAEKKYDDEEVLLPKKQVPAGTRMGDQLDVFIYRDSADRLIATTNHPIITMGELAVLKCVNVTGIGAFMDWGLEKAYLETQSPYKAGDAVSGTVFEFNQNLGAFVAVDNRYSALIPMKEIHSRINVGETVEARVANVREDGKLNLSLQKPIREQINNDSEMVYNIIESYGGTLPFNDKADKEVIEKEFGLSKNAFKRAVGHLLKEGKIRITEKNIIIK